MDPDGDPFVGLTVGNLVLEQRIGEGGMGAVYRATHQALRTSYAVKILRADFGNDDTVVERFRREAMACSRLQHEHVVYVTDFGSDPHAGLYLVMEFVDGPSLAKLLQAQRRMPIGRVLEPAAVAEAIIYLLSPRAAAMTGLSVRVDGGFSVT